MTCSNHQQARKIILSGIVQGVGFRPFIYLHAQAHVVNGWVRNSSGRVEIHVQGALTNLEDFIHTLIGAAPPLSNPAIESIDETACIDTDAFLILESQVSDDADIH